MTRQFLTMLAAAAIGLAAQAESVSFSAANITGEKGSTVTLEVSMDNDFTARDFQCFINLPEGITPTLNAQGRPDVSWAGRQADHSMSTNLVGQQCRVIAFSATGSAISGNSGALFTVPLQLNVAPGEYNVTMTSVYVSKNDGTDVAAPEASASIKVIVYPTGVTLGKSSTELLIGSSETLTATLAPDDVTEDALTWSSSDTSVVTVADGVISAVGLGDATVTVTTVNGKSASCAVKVNPILVTSVTLSESSLELLVDETATLTATVAPDNTTDKTLTWTSSDETVAKVDNGVVTAMGVGEAVITATTVNGVSASCTVKVNPVMATDITIEGGDREIFIGAQTTLTVTFNPANTTDKTLTWTSSDDTVVTVADGVVTGVGLGTATITATATNGVTASVSVKVNEILITDVTLNSTSVVLREGETAQLEATIEPADATFKEVTWTSSDETVATVADGVVTAVGRGHATVTVTTANNLTATCDVHVVMLGDANDDGRVSISDVTVTVNDILEKENASFVAEAADVNNDGEVTVADVVGIANIILGVSPATAAASLAPAYVMEESFAKSSVEQNVLKLSLDNPQNFVAMQFDMELSEGLQIESVALAGANSQTHTLAYNMIDPTHARFVVYSLTNGYFNEGNLVSVTFVEPKEAIDASVRLSDALTVNGQMMESKVNDDVVTFTIGTTGIETVEVEEGCRYFTLDGVEVTGERLQPGVYLRLADGQTRKVMIR